MSAFTLGRSSFGGSDTFGGNSFIPLYVDKDSVLLWNIEAFVDKDFVLLWNINSFVNKDGILLWNILGFVDREFTLLWNVEPSWILVGDNVGVWDTVDDTPAGDMWILVPPSVDVWSEA